MIVHQYPKNVPGSGVSAFGAKVDALMGDEFARFPDALHLEIGTNEVNEFWQAWQCLRQKRTYILTLHDPPVVLFSPFSKWLKNSLPEKVMRRILNRTLGKWIIARVLRGAKRIILLNPAAAAAVTSHYGLTPARVAVAPLPMLLPIKNITAPPQPTVLFFGAINPFKGADVLVKAFALVKAPEWRLEIIGKPTDAVIASQLEALIKQPQLRGRVTMKGYLDDEALVQEIAEAGIIALPYLDNGILQGSGPLIAAMHYGKAIITSDTPVFRAIIGNNERGLRVKQGDEGALTIALQQLIDSPTERRKLGLAAQAYAATAHSDAALKQALIGVYSSL